MPYALLKKVLRQYVGLNDLFKSNQRNAQGANYKEIDLK